MKSKITLTVEGSDIGDTIQISGYKMTVIGKGTNDKGHRYLEFELED